MSADQKLDEWAEELPPPPKAVGVYRPAVVVGNLCHTSGHLPLLPDGTVIRGCVGRDASVDDGYRAARQCGLAMLVTLRAQFGSLDRIARVIKLVGLVNATADCEQHPAIINGCSELFRELFGEEAGVGARSAVGVSGLPLGALVEIEGIFEVRDDV